MSEASVRDAAWHDALLEKYEEEIVTMLSRRLGRDRDAANDLTQKTFATAWERRSRVPDEPQAWLFKTATNHLRNHWRLWLRRKLELCGPEVLISALDKHATAMSLEHVLDLHQALARLSTRDRRILFMAYVEDWQSDEIAVVENLTAEAVRKRLSRACQYIRAALGADYPHGDHGDRPGEGR